MWGGIAFGALGVVVGARVNGIRLLPALDTMAPSVLVAQAIGRWGNWFNQAAFGRPTDLPWGLEIDYEHRPAGYGAETTFHPTFLYEFLWCLAAFAVIVWLDRRLRLGHGRVLALYVMAYTLGRGWIENLRIDTVQLDDVSVCASTSGPRSCCSSWRRSGSSTPGAAGRGARPTCTPRGVPSPP